MQIDLFVTADLVPHVPRAALSEWMAAMGRGHAVLREWPQPHEVESDLAFTGELVLCWPQGHLRADTLWQRRDLDALIRLNYDMAIDGALLAGFISTGEGVLANVQPHGGAGLFHEELARFIASLSGGRVFDPVVQDRSGDATAWRRLFDGSLRNPAHRR